MVSLVRVTAPTDDVFTTQELRDQLRISVASSADEANLAAYLAAATEYVEGVAGCSAMSQQWRLGLDQFPAWSDRWVSGSPLSRPILLPRGPLVKIDSIKYFDDRGVDQTVDFAALGYIVDADAAPPAIYPPYGGSFPIARPVPSSVRVTYTAGMGVDATDLTKPDPTRVRQSVQMAIKFLAGHFYNNREPVPVDVKPEKVPFTLETMLWSSRKYRFDWESYYSC